MSNFFIWRNASVTRAICSGVPFVIISPIAVGQTCHERPRLPGDVLALEASRGRLPGDVLALAASRGRSLPGDVLALVLYRTYG